MEQKIIEMARFYKEKSLFMIFLKQTNKQIKQRKYSGICIWADIKQITVSVIAVKGDGSYRVLRCIQMSAEFTLSLEISIKLA